MQTTLTSQGHVTILRDVRQHFGLKQDMAVCFEFDADIELTQAAETT